MDFFEKANTTTIKCLVRSHEGPAFKRDLAIMVLDGIIYDVYDDSGYYIQDGRFFGENWGLNPNLVIFKKKVACDDKLEHLTKRALLIPIDELERIGVNIKAIRKYVAIPCRDYWTLASYSSYFYKKFFDEYTIFTDSRESCSGSTEIDVVTALGSQYGARSLQPEFRFSTKEAAIEMAKQLNNEWQKYKEQK